jgi:hypothetical protein
MSPSYIGFVFYQLRDNSVNNDGGFWQQERVFVNKTPSPCFTPVSLTPRCYNVPCQFSPFLNLRSLIFGFTWYGWLLTWMLPEELESQGAEQNWKATSPKQTMSNTVRSPFNWDHVIYLQVFYFFVPPTNVTNRTPNLTAARILTMVITWLRCKCCGSDFSQPRQRQYGICSPPSATSIRKLFTNFSTYIR